LDPAGKVAVVTGGNSGLGEAAALRLAAVGAKVVTLDRGGEAPGGLATIDCDVSSGHSVKDAVAQVIERHGRIDILLNNAGIGGLGAIATGEGPGDMAAFRQVIEVNRLGAATVAAEVGHRMTANDPSGPDGERGVIVNTCSIASFGGSEGMGAYAAAKAALAALTLVWARDLSKYNIRVMGIAPGFMATPMVAGLPDSLVDALLKDAEFPKRAGRADEFAELAEFIIRTPLLNGDVIRLDAGTRPPARTRWTQG
jgi:NAD(P)-dependent dehydrogenase (short-subunit alcohol dehydrogenase family)